MQVTISKTIFQNDDVRSETVVRNASAEGAMVHAGAAWSVGDRSEVIESVTYDLASGSADVKLRPTVVDGETIDEALDSHVQQGWIHDAST